MGITNDLFPDELTFNLTDRQLRFCDPIPEPEDIPEPGTGHRGIDNFEAFMKFLALPPRDVVTGQVTAGQQVFDKVGCSACHVPTLTTGPDVNPLFNQRPVPLFADLLLHDIGTGDGIRQAEGQPEEIRTPALWGLRFRRPLLHDGSAATIIDALLQHAHDAQPARDRLARLPASEVASLIAFLKSL